MADSHSAVGSGIECLEAWQARLLILPVTFFLIGALIVAGDWFRLARSHCVFKRRHYILLIAYGLLVFGLGIANQAHQAGDKPYVSSRVIGGLSILPDVVLVVIIYHFLPPHVALPWWLDRMLSASACSGLVLLLVSAIRDYTPEGLERDERIAIFAAAACELVFLLGSIFGSQCSRYFAILGEHGEFRTFVSLDKTANALFVIALLCITAQASLSFDQPPVFSRILAASMLGCVSFLFLVAVAILQHRNVVAEAKKEARSSAVGSIYDEKRDEALEEIEPEAPAAQNAAQKQDIDDNNDVNSDFRVAQRFLQATDHLSDGAAKPAARNPHFGMPDLEAGVDSGTVVWHGKCDSTMRVQSSVSAASWGRLEMMMRARKPSNARRSGHLGRPQSGMTYYGSESSFQDLTAPHTGRTSLFSARTGRRSTVLAQHIPPLPPVASRFWKRAPSPTDVGFAMPMTPGDAPIPLDVVEPKSTGDLRPQQPSKSTLASLTELLWRKKDGEQDDKREAQVYGAGGKSGKHPPTAFSPPRDASAKSLKAVSSIASFRDSEGHGSLPPQYQSSKLFPLPMSTPRKDAEQNTRTNSPGWEYHRNGGSDIQRDASSQSHYGSESSEEAQLLEARRALQVPDATSGALAKRKDKRVKHEVLPKSDAWPDERAEQSVTNPSNQYEMQHLFSSSFREARMRDANTIDEVTEPSTDMSRGQISHCRSSDLSITVESDESSPREGKHQKETQRRTPTCPISSSGGYVPGEAGAAVRRQRSEPTLFTSHLGDTSTETDSSVPSSRTRRAPLGLAVPGTGPRAEAPSQSPLNIPKREASARSSSRGGEGRTAPPSRSQLRPHHARKRSGEEIHLNHSDEENDDAKTIKNGADDWRD